MPVDAVFFFFFNDTATTEIYTLSLHDALPICTGRSGAGWGGGGPRARRGPGPSASPRLRGRSHRNPSRSLCRPRDRKSTRLNSSHANISYAVFCLKKKKKLADIIRRQHSLANL